MCSHAADSWAHHTEKELSTTVFDLDHDSAICLEMSKIVLVNLQLLGLMKHNPDPQWNLERKYYG